MSFIPDSTDLDVDIFGGGHGVAAAALFHLVSSRPPHGPLYLLQFLLSCQVSRQQERGSGEG